MAPPVTVLLQMKIPFDLLSRLKDALVRMEELHLKEFRQVQQRLKSTADEATAERYQHLRQRGRKLTIHNVARLAMEHGMKAFNDAAAALALIAEEGMSKGRPKDA